MERLIADAAKLDKSVKANDLSFGNVVKAIHAVQVEMGIYGTTAKEAGSTISGSFSSMSAAWQNLLTGVADPTQDFDELIDNLVDSALVFADNVMPVVKKGITGTLSLVRQLLPKIAKELPGILSDVLPVIGETSLAVIDAFISTIDENAESFTAMAIPMIENFANGILDLLPEVASLAVDLVLALANGLVENETLSQLIPAVVGIISEIVNILFEPENMKAINSAASDLLIELANGIGEAIPQLVDAVIAIINGIVTFLLDPENIGTIISAAVQIVVAIVGGLISAAPKIGEGVVKLIAEIVENFANTDWEQVGKDIVDGIGNGLSKAWKNIKNWAKNAWDGIVGFFTGESTTIDVPDYAMSSSTISSGNTSYRSPKGVNVVQHIYSQKQTAADLMEEALYAQQRAVYLS